MIDKQEDFLESNLKIFRVKAHEIVQEELSPIANDLMIGKMIGPRKAHKLFTQAKEQTVNRLCKLFKPQ